MYEVTENLKKIVGVTTKVYFMGKHWKSKENSLRNQIRVRESIIRKEGTNTLQYPLKNGYI